MTRTKIVKLEYSHKSIDRIEHRESYTNFYNFSSYYDHDTHKLQNREIRNVEQLLLANRIDQFSLDSQYSFRRSFDL